MTTSGSTNFELDVSDYIEEAFERCGLEACTGYVLAPTPDSNYVCEFHYYYRPTSLTAGADSGTTWLSTNAPNALLYGSLYEAYIYMKGEQDVLQMYEKQSTEAVSRLKDLQKLEKIVSVSQGLPDRPRT